MKLSQLKNFLQVVEIGNLSKAAAAIRIAQPALSRQVKALELELGAQLLNRHSAGVEPTSAGQALATTARRVLADLERARTEVHALEHDPAGTVTVATSETLARPYFARLFAAIAERYPKIQLRLQVQAPAPLMKGLHGGVADIGIINALSADSATAFRPLFVEQAGIFAHSDYLTQWGGVPSQIVAEGDFIMPSSLVESRVIIEQLLGRQGLRVVAEVEGVTNLLDILTAGRGFTVLPCSAGADYVVAGRLALIKLPIPDLSRRIVLAPSAHRVSIQAVELVSAEIVRLTRELAPVTHWTVAPDRSA